MEKIEYPITVRSLSEEDGGGYLAEFPDLPGCIADGETPEEAILEAQDAFKAWMNGSKKFGYHVPEPGSSSGKWNQRVPKLLHSRLVQRAKHEGVSLNTLVVSMLSEMMGRKTHI